MKTKELRGLWRGKHKVYHNYETNEDVFEWIYGVPMQHCDGDWQLLSGKVGAMIIQAVDGNTLGKCTGLRDKNGKLIFEGDIIEVNHPYNGRSIHKVIWWGFCWNLEGFFASCYDYPGLGFSEGTEYMTVIGNAHDNPELTKSTSEYA